MKLTNVALAGCLLLALGACNSIDFKKTKGGMPYKLISGKGGTEVDSGNIVKVNILQKIKDSVTFNSYNTGQPLYIPVTATGNPYDFTEILPSLKAGDSLYTVQLMDTFIARNPQMIPPNFKKGDTIKTSIKILSVFKNAEEAQKDEAAERALAFDRDTAVQTQLGRDIALINNHLSANNINAQKTGKGTFVQIITQGTGAPVEAGKYVSLKYTGSTFEGKIFDTNADASKGHTEPLVFQVGSPGMIRGFDEGIRALREGSKAKIFIPSALAYGPQSPSPDIKPHENLVFDIEVLKVSDQPMQQQMPQMPRNMPDSAVR
jgi:FKBP-type peptidyl-prolyl cis-trans isomerase FkpA